MQVGQCDFMVTPLKARIGLPHSPDSSPGALRGLPGPLFALGSFPAGVESIGTKESICNSVMKDEHAAGNHYDD
jgi:hypothetical protein